MVEREWAYTRFRALLTNRGGAASDCTWGAVRPVIATMLERARDVDSVQFRLNLVTFTVEDLERLDALARQDEGALLSPPWPGPDRGLSGPFVWSGYSAEGLLARTRAVYRGALHAYREIVAGPLSAFGDALGHAALLPARLDGRLRPPQSDRWEDQPVLVYGIRPTGLPGLSGQRVGDDDVRIELLGPEDETWPPDWDEGWWKSASEDLQRYEQRVSGVTTFVRLTQQETVLEVWGNRPATEIALSWVWADLTALGWVKSHRPMDLG